VYRRWRSKAELATAALAHLAVRVPDRLSGDTRRDLSAQLERIRRHYEELRGMALVGALLVEEERHPELLELFRDRVVRPRRSVLRQVLAHGQAEGDVRLDLDLDAAVTLLVGAFYSRYVAGDPFPRSWARQVVDTVWPALCAPGP